MFQAVNTLITFDTGSGSSLNIVASDITTNKGQDKNTLLFSNELWSVIENDLGEVTDFEIVHDTQANPNTANQIRFKSNGIDKLIACNDANFKFFIQSSYYVAELISPVKKYKLAL